jgi:hypothetical protein
MVRVLAYFLALAALLVQLGVAALPTDQICVNFRDSRPACSCCGKRHGQAVKACCQSNGCERCLKVPVPERQVAAQAKVRPTRAQAVVTAAVMPAIVWRGVPVREGPALVARADESPPQIAALRTTKLIL